ncbi:MAG TPA: prepilin peptidase [Terracidiphilus sp.]|nr:prepilin peptidase [Terracidiphilus sp.]
MVRILGASLAALFGLAFGSFLNVCATRWPAHESVVRPRSHCRSCGRTLAWWENLPLLSWLFLRGRCRTCRAPIGWRYPFVELAVAASWAITAWQQLPAFYLPGWSPASIFDAGLFAVEKMFLCWLLIALAVLDLEHLWLPDWLTLGGAALGILINLVRFTVHFFWDTLPLHWTTASELTSHRAYVFDVVLRWLAAMVAAPLFILLVRWLYRSLRGREGMGLGDAKLMLMLAAWLGLSHTLLAFFLGVVVGAIAALTLLAMPRARQSFGDWTLTKLPLGTFLAAGGLVSALWGRPLLAAYLQWASFN